MQLTTASRGLRIYCRTCGWLVELRMRAHRSARSPVGQPCLLYCCAAALSCSTTTGQDGDKAVWDTHVTFRAKSENLPPHSYNTSARSASSRRCDLWPPSIKRHTLSFKSTKGGLMTRLLRDTMCTKGKTDTRTTTSRRLISEAVESFANRKNDWSRISWFSFWKSINITNHSTDLLIIVIIKFPKPPSHMLQTNSPAYPFYPKSLMWQ